MANDGSGWLTIHNMVGLHSHGGTLLTNPSEKWWSESQLGWWHSQLNGKSNPNVPNHQPGKIWRVSIVMGVHSWMVYFIGKSQSKMNDEQGYLHGLETSMWELHWENPWMIEPPLGGTPPSVWGFMGSLFKGLFNLGDFGSTSVFNGTIFSYSTIEKHYSADHLILL